MKGFVAMLEAVIAGIILIGTLAAVATTVIPRSTETDFQSIAVSFLQGLDDQGRLRNLTVTKNPSAIDNEILFPSFNHTTEICDHKGTCVGQRPNTEDVHSGFYFIAGNSIFEPYVVTLYIGDDE